MEFQLFPAGQELEPEPQICGDDYTDQYHVDRRDDDINFVVEYLR